METACYSETLENIYQQTRRNLQVDTNFKLPLLRQAILCEVSFGTLVHSKQKEFMYNTANFSRQ